MAQPLIASMPKDLDLGGGWIVRLTAVDPTTGAAVSGVKVSNVVITVDPLAGAVEQPPGTGGQAAPFPYLVPMSGT